MYISEGTNKPAEEKNGTYCSLTIEYPWTDEDIVCHDTDGSGGASDTREE